MSTTILSDTERERRDALVSRMLESTIGALELFHIYVGDRLGLYRALAKAGPLTAAGLASAAGIDERYAREWLEQQAVAGVLDVHTGNLPADERQFSLPVGHAEVVDDPDSLNYVLPLAKGVASIGAVMPDVLEAFRVGGGVAYEAYGADMRDSIAMLNRPGFINLLGTAWFPAVPELDRRLRSEPAARIADVGCGTGWSAIAIAKAYPTVSVDGFDLDPASIATARRNAEDEGVAGRVTFEIRDASDPRLAGTYDVVTAFETIHDMSDPVGALLAMRGLVKEGGYVIVADERVAEEFTAPGDDVERLMYGWSSLHCLPVGMVDAGSVGTGTIMRPALLREYARRAGFADVVVLPIQADFWRFYQLV